MVAWRRAVTTTTAPRLQGLDDAAVRRAIGAADALALGRAEQAAMQLEPTLARYPDHPEILRLHAGVLNLYGNHTGARQAMERAVQLRPLDALYHNTFATVLDASGDCDAAIGELRRACELEPALATAWLNLGLMLVRSARNDEAIGALRRATAIDPDNTAARTQLADILRMRGQATESGAEYRDILAKQPWIGMAWWGLANLRIGALAGGDIPRMYAAMRDTRSSDDDQIATGFALAKALDEQGRCEEALTALKQANTIARSRRKWNAPAFTQLVDSINRAFTPPPTGTLDSQLGRQVIFIVGLPRSGTTLVEQILASHPDVEGAGELPDLPLTLAEASRRSGCPFPQWVANATPKEWRHLGERYLERTRHWQQHQSRFTDKLPGNWMYMGAIRAMLPGAHIVVCRRDPLETCFSCYRQLLHNNEYTRTPEDLAAFWRDFDRSARHWTQLHPQNTYEHIYEALVANPEASIRQLLGACGLPFDPACLHFNEATREVRSPSAMQVRRPLYANAARTPLYGSLVDPLRAALGLPKFER